MSSSPHIEEKTLLVDGKKIHYLEAGEGNPVVFAHGLFGSSDGLLRLTRLLAERYKVYNPDLPGFGCKEVSQELDSEHTIKAYADFMHAFVKQLGLGKVYVMGHSMGGTIALEWAAKYPEQIEKLAVFEPVLGRNEVSLPARFLSRLAYRVKKSRKLVRWIVNQGAQNEEYARRLSPDDRKEMTKEVYRASLKAAAEISRDLLRGVDLEVYKQVNTPVLLVCGSVGSSISTPKVVNKLVKVLPKVRVETMPQGAHVIIREETRVPAFAKILSDFFSS